MVREKDMEHRKVLMERDTWGNTVMISNTGMEYTDGEVEQYITENINWVIKMDKDITGGQMAMNIMESSRVTRDGDRESHKKTDYFTETHLKITSASAGLNILWLMK